MVFTKHLLKRIYSALVSIRGQQKYAQVLRPVPHFAVCTRSGQLDLSESDQPNFEDICPSQRLQRADENPRMSLDVMISKQIRHRRPALDRALVSSFRSSRIVCARCSASFV